jgi:hypothetical protein
MICQLAVMEYPDEIAPQANAHIGGNHVMGLSSVATALI